MKILIIANANIVFGKELQYELSLKGYDVYLLDFESLSIKHNNKEYCTYKNSFLKYRKLPKIHMFFRLHYIKKIIEAYDFSLVNIHYNRWIYMFLFKALSKQKLVLTYYGSDFYRVSSKTRTMQTKIIELADAITFTNPLTKEAFVTYYTSYEEKSYICRFGLKTLDYIDKNRMVSKTDMQNKLGYDSSKIIITCGYNASKAQQHLKIIEHINTLDTTILSQVQWIFPMTYGDMEYKKDVMDILEQSALHYKVLEDFLYEDDNAYVKLSSDIMINMLETDSFSGSMQEFLYAGNYVITGSWLPYDLFDTMGIVYEKIANVESLKNSLPQAVLTLESHKEKLQKNRAIIGELSHWDNNIDNWIEVYEKI